MKRKIYSIPLWCLMIPFVLSILGIILGSFYDLKISDSIVYTSDKFSAFCETLGESIGYFIYALGGLLCFFGLFPREKVVYKVLGVVIALACLIGSIYYLGSHMTDNGTNHGIVMNKVLAYTVSVILMLFYSVLAVVFLDHHNLDNSLKVGLIILLASLLQLLLINLLKKIGCRPRYRYLIDTSLNVDGDTFRPWYLFQPFQKSGDYFKSWPSGHVGTATLTLMLTILCPLFRFKHKGMEYVTYFVTLSYTLLIAFTRIRCGAHFLSDVSTGLFVSTLCVSLLLFLFRKHPLVLEE